MDPDATLAEIRLAYQGQDWRTVFDRADDLLEWLNDGGFPPKKLSMNDATIVAGNYRYTARKRLKDSP